MKRKSKQGNRWKRYEEEKKALTARGLSQADYEKALRELIKRLRL